MTHAKPTGDDLERKEKVTRMGKKRESQSKFCVVEPCLNYLGAKESLQGSGKSAAETTFRAAC